VATARTIINTSVSTVSGAVANLRDSSASLDASIKNLALKKAASSVNDISAQASQVKASEAEVLNTRAQLLRTEIISPFSGLITKMDLKTGEIVSPNVAKVSLISIGAFEIESFVPEVAIANIKIGDPAKVTLDAYGVSTYFNAKVVRVDPAETVRDGVSTYKTVLEFNERDSRVKSGMTANVLITTAYIKAAIAVPQGVVSIRGDDRFVTLLVNNATVEKQVVTGRVSSSGEIEIINGLNQGDVVVLKSVK
jgi:macrolide-specific efflux system membrane fusion protein